MTNLHIEGTDDTPEVTLDKQNGIFEISGRSLPEDSIEFFRPVMEWLAEYRKLPNPVTNFVIKLDYMNTASSKLIQDVLLALQNIPGARVMWYFQEDDEDMETTGHEYSEYVRVPFEFRTY
jgi:hypothetical protein